ncbi:MAG: ParB N-terminal domain-containing protein [Mangrovicoccus sp.]|nr:ParB N-terminal domain-containing protein [Mangrovicoccus sp.]
MQIEMMPTDRLVPYIRNARTHSADQVAQIAASIAEFGFTNPILIGADGVIIAGHGRLQAARSLGLAEVPVIVLDHLSEAQRRALVIADNRIAEHAGWDAQMLAAEIAALRDEAFDLDVIGFSEEELHDLLDGLDDPAADGIGFGSHAAGGADMTAAPASAATPSTTLAERFGIPPFSVLDARKGWWQDRKRAWLDLGIRSELGRGEGDRACPGGSPMPGNGSRKDYRPGAARREASNG